MDFVVHVIFSLSDVVVGLVSLGMKFVDGGLDDVDGLLGVCDEGVEGAYLFLVAFVIDGVTFHLEDEAV